VYTNDPKFIKSVPNGKLYQTYAEETPINVVHVYGSPYQMGYAHGLLMKEQINMVIPELIEYIDAQIDQYIGFLPDFIRKEIELAGVMGALLLTHEITKSYTPHYFFEELKGISDGSGMDYNYLLAAHMIPELIQAACSIVGAWGQATNNITRNGPLYQLRALDWITDGPFQKFPALIVYHPNQGHNFSIFTWTGFVGAITGFSSTPMGICEKVWIDYKGHQNRFGYPFHFLLRDILQFDNSTDDVINRIQAATRTCSIWIGVGNPIDKFKVIQYSYEYYKVLNDRNYPSYDKHPSYNNVVYVDKHVQPSGDSCLGYAIGQNYGNINVDSMLQFSALHETGDTHIAVYDYTNMAIYVSSAGIYNPKNGTVPAFKRRFTKFNMVKLFSESQ
jgi:hypothetical protein